MGYFSNHDEWEYWAASNCYKCAHWPKGDSDAPCPVEMAHMLYNYELCNAADNPGKTILDMLIPRNKAGTGNKKCAMFKDRAGVSDKQLRDWEKYKAAMSESQKGTDP